MPPRNCDRDVSGLRIRPQANTPSIRATRTSPVSAFTRTSPNCAPNACRANGSCARMSSPVSASASSPSSGTLPSRPSICSRSAVIALTIAEPHEVVPIDPPASIANGSALSPMSTRTRSSGTSSASAAICVSTVRAPVPMSAAPMPTTNVPSAFARANADDGARRAGYVDDATPVPTSQRAVAPRARGRVAAVPAEALRALAQALRRRPRELNGSPLSGSVVGLVAHAQLDRVEAGRVRELVHRATRARTCPGVSPGARIHDGVGTSSATRRWRRPPVAAPRTSSASARRSARRTP